MSSVFTEQGIVMLSVVLRSDIAIQVRIKIMDSLPVMNDDGEIIEYNIYQPVLIVRYSADDKLYLYDIQNIKKKRAARLNSKLLYGSKLRFLPTMIEQFTK